MHNLLTEPLIRAKTTGGTVNKLSLPDVLAALVRDEITSFPALRPHQVPSWHMFLAQLGALAVHRAGQTDLPDTARDWCTVIRALTPEFPEDEPWQLVVADRQKPAFMQAPEPECGIKYTGSAGTPDALDMLVTSKNHDLKQAVASTADLDEWMFALISLQTGEGYNGSGNNGIARMNGGSSSRVCLGLVPVPTNKANDCTTAVSPGSRFLWDTAKLLRDRAQLLQSYTALGYLNTGGLALLWPLPWPDGEKVELAQLDPWFIEICRRIRLQAAPAGLTADTGTTKAERVNAKMCNGVTGDAWAPVSIKGGKDKSLTLGEQNFDYRLLSKLLFGDGDTMNYRLPPMLELSRLEQKNADNWLLIAQAIGRGNSKTYGYRERYIPITMQAAVAIGRTKQRESLGMLAKKQGDEIKKFTSTLGYAIAVFAEEGSRDKIGKESYKHAVPFQDRLTEAADNLFFPTLWQRYEAAQIEDKPARHQARDAARLSFLKSLHQTSLELLAEALDALPCSALFRHRAVVLAENTYRGIIISEKKGFPELRPAPTGNDTFKDTDQEDQPHDTAPAP